MAYLDLSATSATLMMPSAEIRQNIADARLSAAAREVIRFAVREPLSSIAPPSRLRALAGKAFGLQRINPLADPRLEALRCYTVRSARMNATERDQQQLSDAGFSDSEIRDAEAMIRRLAPAPSNRNATLMTDLMATLLMLGAYVWVKSRLGDSAIAAIIVMTLGLPLVVSVRPRSA